MLNGRFASDKNGEFTCFANGGCSVVDYTLATTSLFSFVNNFEVVENDNCTHLPQAVYLSRIPVSHYEESSRRVMNVNDCTVRKLYKWNSHSYEMLFSEIVQSEVSVFHDELEKNDVTGAAKVLSGMLESVCIEKKSHRTSGISTHDNAPWWDEDLEDLKKQKYKCLRLFRLEHSDTAFMEYCHVKKLFKSLVKSKKSRYKEVMKEKVENCSSISEFWKVIK